MTKGECEQSTVARLGLDRIESRPPNDANPVRLAEALLLEADVDWPAGVAFRLSRWSTCPGEQTHSLEMVEEKRTAPRKPTASPDRATPATDLPSVEPAANPAGH